MFPLEGALSALHCSTISAKSYSDNIVEHVRVASPREILVLKSNIHIGKLHLHHQLELGDT